MCQRRCADASSFLLSASANFLGMAIGFFRYGRMTLYALTGLSLDRPSPAPVTTPNLGGSFFSGFSCGFVSTRPGALLLSSVSARAEAQSSAMMRWRIGRGVI